VISSLGTDALDADLRLNYGWAVDTLPFPPFRLLEAGTEEFERVLENCRGEGDAGKRGERRTFDCQMMGCMVWGNSKAKAWGSLLAMLGMNREEVSLIMMMIEWGARFHECP
jgi:hypothetical protein